MALHDTISNNKGKLIEELCVLFTRKIAKAVEKLE
jgi:hypothetical protein